MGRGKGHPFTRPDLFCYAALAPFNAAPVFFSCSMRRFPSISMCLPPSSCLHPVVDMFVFLCPRGFSLMRAVSPFMPSVSFFNANLSFSYAAPSSSYAPRRRWDGGRGTLLQDPTFFVMRHWLLLMLRLSFSYAP